MIGQLTTWLKGEKHFCDGQTMKDRHLAMAILRRVSFRTQVAQHCAQIENVALPGKAPDRSLAQPLVLLPFLLFVHRHTSMLSV
jgi:hypothetical protein